MVLVRFYYHLQQWALCVMNNNCDSVIFLNENKNENGEKWENNKYVNEN